jgi:uncharacterized protein
MIAGEAEAKASHLARLFGSAEKAHGYGTKAAKQIAALCSAMALGLTLSVSAANFDCGAVKLAAEKLVCSDQELSGLDEQLAAAYRKALGEAKNPAALRAEQQQWLREVRDACNDAECLRWAYQGRILGVSDYAKLENVREADKAKRVQELFERFSGRLSDTTMPRNRAQCERLMRDLAKGSPRVTFVEPVVRTADWSHPAFKRFNRCRTAHSDTAESYFNGLGIGYQPDIGGPYRLYRLDRDRTAGGDSEEVIYVQGEYNGAYKPDTFFISPQGCERGDKVHSVEREQIDDKVGRSGVNALVLHERRRLVISASWMAKGASISATELFYKPGPTVFQCLWLAD